MNLMIYYISNFVTLITLLNTSSATSKPYAYYYNMPSKLCCTSKVPIINHINSFFSVENNNIFLGLQCKSQVRKFVNNA